MFTVAIKFITLQFCFKSIQLGLLLEDHSVQKLIVEKRFVIVEIGAPILEDQVFEGSSGFHDRLAGTTHSQTMAGIARRTASAATIQERMALPITTSRDRRLHLKKLLESSARFVARLRATVKCCPGVPCKCVGRCWRATAGSCRCGKEVQAGGVHAFLTYNRNVTFALAQVKSPLPWQRRLRACRSRRKHGLRG